MNLTRSPRRSLSALTLTASALGAALGLGAAPAGAVVPPQCLGSEARFFVCGAYDSFADRTPSQGEVDYWVPKLPAKKSLFISTLGRSLESRALIVEQAYWNYADRLVSDLESSYWEGEILKPDGFRRLQAALYNEVEATPEDLVDWAYHGVVGREATDAERTYWAGVAEAKGAGRMADLRPVHVRQRAGLLPGQRQPRLLGREAAHRDPLPRRPDRHRRRGVPGGRHRVHHVHPAGAHRVRARMTRSHPPLGSRPGRRLGVGSSRCGRPRTRRSAARACPSTHPTRWAVPSEGASEGGAPGHRR
jgi:hypothetical protein